MIAALRVEDSDRPLRRTAGRGRRRGSPEIANQAIATSRSNTRRCRSWSKWTKRWPPERQRSSRAAPTLAASRHKPRRRRPWLSRSRRRSRGALLHAGSDARIARDSRRGRELERRRAYGLVFEPGNFHRARRPCGALQLPPDKVRVITQYLGGGFGSKFGAGAEVVIAARLARLASAPVKLMLPRAAEHVATGNRPSSWQRVKLGAGADGKLTAIELTSHGSGGIGGGAGASGPYRSIYNAPTSISKSATSISTRDRRRRCERRDGRRDASHSSWRSTSWRAS